MRRIFMTQLPDERRAAGFRPGLLPHESRPGARMITLYAFRNIFEGGAGETKDLRAQWALEECGLPYRVHALDQVAGDLQSEAYSRISPFHQVPVIDDDGFVLSE